MEKKDLTELLQSGRIVELRDGNMGIIIATHKGLVIQLEKTGANILRWDSQLKNLYHTDFDIVIIREIKDEQDTVRGWFKDGNAPIIWERKEVKEYTLDEVLKMAGLDKAEVKVVG